MTRRKYTEKALIPGCRAVGYSRVSSSEQVDGYAIDAQKNSIRAQSAREGWDLKEIYVDEGFSAYGKKSRARPEFNRMMEDAEAGQFDVLIVDRIDRFGRDPAHTFEAQQTLIDLGITFVSVRESVDITNNSGKFAAGVMSLSAEQHSAAISDNLRDTIITKNSMGKAWGRPPYGYQMCDNRCPRNDDSHPYWHQHDEKAPVVRKIFKLYESGKYSSAGIAKWLNECGYRTNGKWVDMPGIEFEGNNFTSHAVQDILKNSRYIGMIIDPTVETGERPGLQVPIIDKDLFERVQVRMAKNTVGHRNVGRKSKVPSILERIVYCYICGSMYQVSNNGSHKGKYLRMREGADSPDCVCMNHSFVSKHVEKDLERLFQYFTLDGSWKDRVLTELMKTSDVALIKKERKEIQDSIRRANVAYLKVKSIDEETYTAQYLELNDRLMSLRTPEFDSVAKAGELLENFGKIWRGASNVDKNEFLNTIFDAINVDPQTKRVHSLIPKDTFAIPIRSMAARNDVALEEISQNSRLSDDVRGYVYQLPTNPLKILFTHELPLTGLPDRIKDRRYEWGMSRVQLAERLGVYDSTIASWEKGSTPPMEMFEVLSEWLAEEPPEWAIKEADIPGLGQRVKEHRQAWGLTQIELAERIGVSPHAIGSCENGSTPSMPTISKLTPWLAEKAPVRRVKQSIDKEFGKRIEKKRLKLGMNQIALGKHLGVDRKQVSRWEEGLRSPSKTNAVIVAEWLSNPEDYTLAQRLRDKRKMLGTTQKDIAELFGVTLVTIKSWENQRAFPSPNNLSRVITWLSRGHLHRKPEQQPEFAIFVLPMKEKRESLGIGTLTLALHLGVGKNRVREWETGRSIPSEAGCRKIGNWLEAA